MKWNSGVASAYTRTNANNSPVENWLTFISTSGSFGFKLAGLQYESTLQCLDISCLSRLCQNKQDCGKHKVTFLADFFHRHLQLIQLIKRWVKRLSDYISFKRNVYIIKECTRDNNVFVIFTHMTSCATKNKGPNQLYNLYNRMIQYILVCINKVVCNSQAIHPIITWLKEPNVYV